MEIWINPQCSKCRAAITVLDAEGTEYTVRRYLDDPPTPAELAEVLDRLALEPWDICRTGEPIAVELGLADWPKDAAARDRWLSAMSGHPVLIQRPIITADDGTAIVARTESAVRSALPGRPSPATPATPATPPTSPMPPASRVSSSFPTFPTFPTRQGA